MNAWCQAPLLVGLREIGILLPNNQRQHRTSHIQKDVLLATLRADLQAAYATEKALEQALFSVEAQNI